MEAEREPFEFLGVIIGSYTGWDDLGDDEGIQVYGYEPAPGVALPSADILSVNFVTGVVNAWQKGAPDDNAGEVHNMLDVLVKFYHSPKKGETVAYNS